MKHLPVVCALLACASLAQVPAPAAAAPQLPGVLSTAAATWPLDHVVHDQAPDGRLWAHGATWKASFGSDGFTYVPYLAGAPHDLPLAFRIAALRVGGHELGFATDAAPARVADRVWFDRGAVRETYDLAAQQVEQGFVVDTALRGDLELELAIATALVEDAQRPGLQFGCEFGEVRYGEAFVVRGAERHPLPATFADGVLRLRVPAALRGDGPVVIDPVLSTQSASTAGVNLQPDVAFDATNQCWLVCWEHEFSSTDHDLYCELFDANGMPIAGSVFAIDFTTASASGPRVANLDAADRFLVAFTYNDPMNGNRRMAYARTRDAGGGTAVGPYVLLSDPALPGDHSGVDVGADSGTGPGNHDWLVVWSNLRTINDCEIRGRLVLGSGQPRSANVLAIETVGTQFNANVQISRGNGNGLVDHPQWLVVYGRYFGATVAQIHCHAVDPDGVVGAETPIEDGQGRNLYPQVSSPLRDGARSVFLVTYRRESPAAARAATVRFTTTWQGTGWIDLAQLLGVQPDWLRADSDGERFVLASKEFFAQDCGLRTLGWTGGGLIEQNFGYVQSGAEVEVAACRASGGEPGLYGATLLQSGTNGTVPRLVRYAGRQAGTMTTVRPTGCNGLTLTASTSSVLGATLQFAVGNAGAAVPGFVFGSAAVVPIAICPACSLGLRLDMPTVALVGSSLAIAIPNDPMLVGQDYAVQGFAFGGGTCFGSFSFSDTVQFTVR